MSLAQLNHSILYLFWGLVRNNVLGLPFYLQVPQALLPIGISPLTHPLRGGVIKARGFAYSLLLDEFYHLEPYIKFLLVLS